MTINVTKSFLPPIDEYFEKVKEIYSSGILTNNGPFVKELQNELCSFLSVKNLHYLTNGTIALQVALEALGIKDGEIITTPFSYVATTSSIIWQRCKPVFVDIELDNFTIDVDKIESAITPKTKAIMAVHVFGYACNVDKIQQIADKHGLKVIYDGAHAFACNLNGKSLLSYGDISTCSFHATKVFHTIEGGACVVRDESVSKKLELIKKFGHVGDEHFTLGINAKQSEFHAAMGLLNLKYLDFCINRRKLLSETYDSMLISKLKRPKMQNELDYNYSYYPVVFENESLLLNVLSKLKEHGILARRYFYPSLNELPYVEQQNCPISSDISKRVACLPLYPDLDINEAKSISEIVLRLI